MQWMAVLPQQQQLQFPDSSSTERHSVRPDGPPIQSRTTAAATVEPAAPALKTPDAAETPQTVPASLLSVYRKSLREKRLRGANLDTVGSHETSFRHFDRWAAQLHRLLTPVQLLSEPDCLTELARWLVCDRRLSPVTVSRTMTHLAMLAKSLKIDADKPTPEQIRRLSESQKDASARQPAALPSSSKPATQSKTSSTVATESAWQWLPAGLQLDADQSAAFRHLVRSFKTIPSGSQASELLSGVPCLAGLGESERDALSDVLRSARRVPHFAEIDAIAKAAAVATQPYGKHSPYFWRGWIRLLAFIGCRSRDVVSVLARKPGLLRKDVILDSLCPAADVNTILRTDLHSSAGWMQYRIGKDHKSDCRQILFPMPAWLRAWLQFWLEYSAGADRVFSSPVSGRKSLAQATLTAAWNQIVDAAGVDPRLVPSEGSGNRIALRKYAATWWETATLQARSDFSLAQKTAWYVLHHAEVTTAARHYLNTQAIVLPLMLELLPAWPVPAADALPVSMLPE